MAQDCDPEEDWDQPIATNTPDDVRSGVDEAAYNPPDVEE